MSIVLGWAALVAVSAGLTFGLDAAGVPAALLIGPMVVAIAFGVAGSGLRVRREVFVAAQGVVGCLIAESVSGDILYEVVRDWPAMLFGLATTMAASTSVGWVSARFGSLPGATAAWGSTPGAASAMVGMAGDYGADVRLVAAMQYIRVLLVVLAASATARLLLPPVTPETSGMLTPSGSAAAPIDHEWVGLAVTLAVALGGSWLGRSLRVPAGGLLVPLAIGGILNATGLVHLVTPRGLLALVYGLIGWSIGLQFEGATLRRSARALPEIALGALVLIALCGLGALAMARFLAIPTLTALLATSPGGIDTIAIIALAGGADTPFVMAQQTLRVLVVIATAPVIARALSRVSLRRRGLDTPEDAP